MEKLAIIGFGAQGKLIFNAVNSLLGDVIELAAVCDIIAVQNPANTL